MLRWSPIIVGLLAYIGPVLSSVQADPCGMVPPPPPPYLQSTTVIERVGAQKTYVFYKNGIESFVLRPGFKGKLDNFGMLIPFPSAPAIRKVPNEIFSHIAAAVDPPEVVVTVRRRWRRFGRGMARPTAAKSVGARAKPENDLALHQVRVVRQEAVGMYQVAVLQAGSPMALKKWMKRNGYVYPKGMDKVVYEYVRARWTFVAVKSKVSGKKGLSPRPGMRSTKTSFPKGGYFTGKVQAMGFRFRSRRLVVPMRLSAFNKGKLRNIVYLLTNGPKRIKRISRKFVMRQMSGKELYRNVTEPLPLRIRGGSLKMLSKWRWQQAQRLRNPSPHNGHARDLFASDLMAVRKNKLALPHEEEKKELLRIEERLRLRGKHIDKLNQKVLASFRSKAVKTALWSLRNMTLTVVDGDFPREVIAADNLSFASYRMPRKCNSHRFYNARTLSKSKCGTRGNRGIGRLYTKRGPHFKPFRKKQTQQKARRRKRGGRYYFRLIKQLSNVKRADAAVKKLVRAGQKAVPYLFGEAIEGFKWTRRGWSIVALTEINGDNIAKGLLKLAADGKQHMLVRNWSAAAFVKNAAGTQDLLKVTGLARQMPALKRPLRKRIEELIQKEPKPAAMLFSFAARYGQFRSWLQPLLRSQSVDDTIEQMVRGKDLPTRRLAASYATAHMQKDNLGTIRSYLKFMRFRNRAGKVPWDGGPLYMPTWPTTRLPAFGLWQWRNRIRNTTFRVAPDAIPQTLRNLADQFQKARSKWQALVKKKQESNKQLKGLSRKMMRHLLAWAIWADQRKQKKELRKIKNNLLSWQLQSSAGILRLTGQHSLERWLLHWHKTAGKDEYDKLLRLAVVHRSSRYRHRTIKRRIALIAKRWKQYLTSINEGCFSYTYYRGARSHFRTYKGYTYSVPVCRQKCAQGGFKYAALLRGSICRCGNSFTGLPRRPNNHCRYQCSRSRRYTCGGYQAVSVYRADGPQEP